MCGMRGVLKIFAIRMIYLPEFWVKMICDEVYVEQSIFLHEGYVKTHEVGIGNSMPIINPIDGRSLSYVVPYVNCFLQALFAESCKAVL